LGSDAGSRNTLLSRETTAYSTGTVFVHDVVKGNKASTSDDDVFGVVAPI